MQSKVQKYFVIPMLVEGKPSWNKRSDYEAFSSLWIYFCGFVKDKPELEKIMN